jgi:hypothetical protein
MKSVKVAIVGSLITAALCTFPGLVAGPAEGKQWIKTTPSRFVVSIPGRRALRPYRNPRVCHVHLETQNEQREKSTARRLCNSSTVDERPTFR